MTIRQLIRARQPRDEGGFTMVFVALAVLAMMAMVALALDGSQDYATRRHMQNAADSAALAATLKLQQARAGAAPATTVLSTAQSVAAAHGADSGLTTCT